VSDSIAVFQRLCCGVAHIPAWVVGLVLAIGVAVAAWRAGSLSPSGAAAAVVVGTLAMAAGWTWGVLLILYFVSTSLLSRFRASHKAARVGDRVEKGGARDAVQVLANGGLFAGAALGQTVSPNVLWHWLAAGALSASAADTWATELGTLSTRAPRSILGWRTVPVGTSGAVTLAGFAAASAAALLFGLLASALGWPDGTMAAALAGGVGGCVLDSALGASLQARRWCESCGAATEQRVHRCGRATTIVAGMRWLDNDGVNLLATMAGALLGAAAASYL
jgi:uncharacterized protein (TIGR00297 family)